MFFNVFLASVASMLAIAWSVFLLPIAGYVTMFTITNDKQKVHTTIKNIERLARTSLVRYERGKQTSHGVAVCLRWRQSFLAYITIGSSGDESDGASPVISLLCTHGVFKELLTDAKEPDSDAASEGGAETPIEIFERCGTFRYLYYQSRNVDLSRFTPTTHQRAMMDRIVPLFRKLGNRGCVYVQGEPGKGKTLMAMLIAQEMGAKFCKTFNPTDPGDTMANLIEATNPTRESPLLLLMDECDGLFRRVHAGELKRHDEIPIAVHNKDTLNAWMDDLAQFTDNVMVLFISNQAKEKIDLLDPSYIRPGRIHAYEVM